MIRSLALAIVLALGAAPALAGDAATQEAPTKVAPKGITWFATLDSARTAAKRTGKAMLITSAAPQCHQVPGIWWPGKQGTDRHFLSDATVVAAAQDLICVRMATYESAEEATFLQSVTKTRSGKLENTVFGLYAPDGTTRLARTSRGPHQLYGSATELAAALRKAAQQHPGKANAARGMPYADDVRLGLNIAACDGVPFVVVREGTKSKALESALEPLAWSTERAGRFVYATATEATPLDTITGIEASAALLVIAPGQFGLKGKVLAQTADVTTEAINATLDKALADFTPSAKETRSQIRAGRKAGATWETAIPVTDPGGGPAGRGGREGREGHGGREGRRPPPGHDGPPPHHRGPPPGREGPPPAEDEG